jgi:hypothetical protein
MADDSGATFGINMHSNRHGAGPARDRISAGTIDEFDVIVLFKPHQKFVEIAIAHGIFPPSKQAQYTGTGLPGLGSRGMP